MNALRLLLDITAHGLGHLAQCAPVVAALREADTLELVVRSGLPSQLLHDRLGSILRHIATETDFGAVMDGTLAVDTRATVARYRALHVRLPDEISTLADTLRTLRCDAVLSNVSYIAPAAAAVAGIPCVVFSSLTWHDVLLACCPDAADLTAGMLAAYRTATRVLRLVPGTAFHELDTTAVTQPIARVGRQRRDALVRQLGGDAQRPVALLAFGGMLPAAPPPLATTPEEFQVLGPAAWRETGIVATESIGLPFADLLASVDVVVSKPGYGIVTELACCGTPSVLVTRPDWPEEPCLSDWLAARARCVVADRLSDVTPATLRRSLALPEPGVPRPQPGGETIVATAVCRTIRSGGVQSQ